MVFEKNSWITVQKGKKENHGKPKAAACEDALDEKGSLADRGHCSQYTEKRWEMVSRV